MLDRLAHLANRRGWRVIAIALLFFVVAGALSAGVADRLLPYDADDPDTESVIASDELEDAGYGGADLVVLVEGVDPRSAQGRDEVEAITRALRADRDVGEVSGFASTGSRAFIARDRNATYLTATLRPEDDRGQQDAAERIAEAFADDRDVAVGGQALAQAQVNKQVEEDLRRAEMLAFPLLFLLSLLFFRSLVAALLPLLVGGLAIVGTMVMLRAASELTDVSIFALNLVTGLGLGLAIDYSLFVVSRYREEIARSGPGLEAMRRTMATSGRTVLFSSLTVAGAMASLMVFPQNFLFSMGLGGSLVALIAAAISLVILPAVLTVLGERVNALSPGFLRRRAERDARSTTEGFWYRLSQTVMRFPGRIAAASAVLLIALGIPFLGINFTSVDPQVLPESASARTVDTALRDDFPPFRTTPITLQLTDANGAAARRTADAVARIDGVAAVNPPQRLRGGVYAIEAIPSAPPLAQRSQDLVARVRSEVDEARVTGFTASYLDLQDSLGEHLPLVLAIVVVTTFIVLFLMTGSVVLPLKQVLMNALGLSATFGILVLIFQDGRFEGLLDYTSQGGLESTQPLLLFAVAFGLSTDYGVFLLARIKEARDGGHSDRESVAIGLERTGRIVTAAALLFSIAIGAFVTSEIIFIKQVGLGTAIAVLIDATLIRALLVPSLMRMLGRWNWWAPSPLRRLHDRVGLSEA